MSLSPLDATVALIAVDLQVSTAPRMSPDVFADVVDRTNRIAHACRRAGLPVIIATVSGGSPGRTEMTRSYGVATTPVEGAAPVPGLRVDGADLRIERQAWSAFVGTDLAQTLRASGVTQVVLTGVATSIGVESTARDAYALGFSVVVVADAVTDFRVEVGAAHLAEIFPLLSEVGMSDDVVRQLTERNTDR